MLQNLAAGVQVSQNTGVPGETACGIVRDRPGLTGEEVIRAIKWNVPYPTWEEISFVQRWCIVTEGVVILNHLVGSGAIRREKDEAGINRYF